MVLRWVPYALAHGHDLLVTYHLHYLDGVNLRWNTSLPLPGLLLAPVTATWGRHPQLGLDHPGQDLLRGPAAPG